MAPKTKPADCSCSPRCHWCGGPSEELGRLCAPDCSFVRPRFVQDPEGEAREEAREKVSLRRYANRLRTS